MAAIVFYNLNILLGFGILAVSFLWPQTHLLARASIENGPYEVATAVILLLGAFALLWFGIRHFSRLGAGSLLTLASLGMALLCFLGAGEEISWGQHWLRFESGDFFAQHNHQKETNLHNLLPAIVFSTAINVVIYGGFTLLPLIHWAFPGNPVSRLIRRMGAGGFIPDLNVALMLILANCFHAWLIPATYSDTAVLVLCWLLTAGLMLTRHRRVHTYQWWMLGLALAGFGLCVLVKEVFRHHNMQYEIRECLTAFVIVYWALQWARVRPQSSS